MPHSDPALRRHPPIHGVTPRLAAAYAEALSWLRRDEVVGVFVGPRYRRQQKVSDRLCINVMVREKRPESALRSRSILPRSVRGIPVDIIEGGYELQKALRPGGKIAQRGNGDAGTLGMFVTDDDTNEPCLLTAGHVFSGAGKDVMMSPDLRVARLVRKVYDYRGDGALARLDLPNSVEADPIPWDLTSSPAGVGRASVNSRLRKSGYGSGVTVAFVERAGQQSVKIDGATLSCRLLQLRPIPWQDDIVSDPGDSGAIWIDQTSRIAVGLHVAGDLPGSQSECGWACDLIDVLKALRASYEP